MITYAYVRSRRIKVVELFARGRRKTPSAPWRPDISTLHIRIEDERLMLASKSTSMEWVSDTSSLDGIFAFQRGTDQNH
uniref:Uncharacterized protein n=1 Tax=Utricularia reniformis TaxID=192314 RepID=A0A1Y0B4S8_9LAMI|nr:hypothetical protein AEK19_MT2253 [Utricularia reniformis]ART32398.1 hypothetical protein AEK19_MT2253 [Utricularia reniformis]